MMDYNEKYEILKRRTDTHEDFIQGCHEDISTLRLQMGDARHHMNCIQKDMNSLSLDIKEMDSNVRDLDSRHNNITLTVIEYMNELRDSRRETGAHQEEGDPVSEVQESTCDSPAQQTLPFPESVNIPSPYPEIPSIRASDVNFDGTVNNTVSINPGRFKGTTRYIDWERVDNWLAAAGEVVELLRAKQADYGSSNILTTRHAGLAVRLTDKTARLRNLQKFWEDAGESSPGFESIRDTYMDIAGYGIIGLMLIDGLFPGQDDVS